jgi:hypothetical protein
MVTGIETAGLVLAILPLVIEGAKVYKHGLDSLRDVASNRRRDVKLQDFYDDFFIETDYLHGQLVELVNGLPALSTGSKEALKASGNLAMWEEDPTIRAALFSHFKAQKDLDMFFLIMSRVMVLFGQLIKDEATLLSKGDQVGSPVQVY